MEVGACCCLAAIPNEIVCNDVDQDDFPSAPLPIRGLLRLEMKPFFVRVSREVVHQEPQSLVIRWGDTREIGRRHLGLSIEEIGLKLFVSVRMNGRLRCKPLQAIRFRPRGARAIDRPPTSWITLRHVFGDWKEFGVPIGEIVGWMRLGRIPIPAEFDAPRRKPRAAPTISHGRLDD
jgi:hypothetical protein